MVASLGCPLRYRLPDFIIRTSHHPPSVTKPLLEVADLRTQFESEEGVIRAVNGVSFTVDEGSVLGIVGESGCGKSVTALSIMRLIDPPGRVTSGQAIFHDEESERDRVTHEMPSFP